MGSYATLSCVIFQLASKDKCWAQVLRAVLLAALSAGQLLLNILSPLPSWAEENETKTNNEPRRITVALALGGGGTRGVAHIGVLRALSEEGIPIDAIAGTSMGAIVGGLFAAGTPLHEIEKGFRTRKIEKAFDTVPLSVRIALIPIFAIPRIFGYRPYDGLYRGGIFANYLNKQLPEGKKNMEDLVHPKFWAIASNLLDGESYVIKSGNIGKALQASSAIPALRRPVEYSDALLVDGGIVANCPVSRAREMGCDFVIAVDVDDQIECVAKDAFRKVGSVPQRCISMNLRTLDWPQISGADAVIHPDLRNIKLLSHQESDVTKALNAGEMAARRAAPIIKKQLADLQKTLDK